jgi:hypothetical protein
MLIPIWEDSSDKRLQFGTHDAIWLWCRVQMDCMARRHVLTPPGVQRRCRRNPAGPTRVNVYLFIQHFCSHRFPPVLEMQPVDARASG